MKAPLLLGLVLAASSGGCSQPAKKDCETTISALNTLPFDTPRSEDERRNQLATLGEAALGWEAVAQGLGTEELRRRGGELAGLAAERKRILEGARLLPPPASPSTTGSALPPSSPEEERKQALRDAAGLAAASMVGGSWPSEVRERLDANRAAYEAKRLELVDWCLERR